MVPTVASELATATRATLTGDVFTSSRLLSQTGLARRGRRPIQLLDRLVGHLDEHAAVQPLCEEAGFEEVPWLPGLHALGPLQSTRVQPLESRPLVTGSAQGE